jgi:hypothetical protein
VAVEFSLGLAVGLSEMRTWGCRLVFLNGDSSNWWTSLAGLKKNWEKKSLKPLDLIKDFSWGLQKSVS